MTIPRYRALLAHWGRHPRPEWLIAGYLGFKPTPEMRVVAVASRPRVSPPTGALLNLFNSLGGSKPGTTTVVLGT